MAHFPAHMDKIETAICNKLITEILNAGYHIRVFDGEEWGTNPTRDRAEIQRETAATCTTNYVVCLKDGQAFKRRGEFCLIHGNGMDVISDIVAPADFIDELDAMSDRANR